MKSSVFQNDNLKTINPLPHFHTYLRNVLFFIKGQMNPYS